MADLADSILTYIATIVEPHLAATIATIGADKRVSLRLQFIDTPYMIARIEPDGAGHHILLSRGWLLRLGLALTVVERMWATLTERPPLLALNFNSVFDDYFFGIECNADFNFRAVPDLAPLFIDGFDEHDLARRVASFEVTFQERKGGGDGLLDFTLPTAISEPTADRLLLCAEFLLLHELAHALNGHQSFMALSSDAVLTEMPAQRIFRDSYKRKAAEVDADSYALDWLVQARIAKRDIIDLRSALLDVLIPVFFLLASFDIGRRTIHGYQGMFASHPLPDVRVVAAADILTDLLPELGAGCRDLVRQCRNEAVKYSIESFQRLGIPAGAFYIMGNRLVTLDDQFTSELSVVAILRQELGAIHDEFRHIGRRTKPESDWLYEPFDMKPAEVREAAKQAAIAMFEGKNIVATEEDLSRVGQARMIEAKRRLGGKGGHLILTHHGENSYDSPFMKPDWWGF